MEAIDLDFLIEYYSKIPTKRWAVSSRELEKTKLNGEKVICHCAVGLLHSHDFGISKSYVKCFKVEDFACRLPDPKGLVPDFKSPIVRVNNGRNDYDGGHPFYQTIRTPKGRVLAFLKDVREKYGNIASK